MWESTPELRGMVCASVTTADDARRARRAGWSVYLALPVGATPPKRAIECQSHRGVQCVTCGICDGTRDATIWTHAHGALKGVLR